MTVVPEGAQRSDDGYYWWDGNAWQEIGEVTADELAQITEPEHITDRTADYFRPDPDMYADDSSQAEAADQLSDEAA